MSVPGVTRNYSLDDVTCTISDFLVNEYAAGDAIGVAFDEDDFVVSQGSHGSVLRAKKHNNVAEVTIRIMQGSPVNDFLSARHAQDRLTRQGAFPFYLKDNNGLTLIHAPYAWVKGWPEVNLNEEPSEVEWTIKISNPVIHIGSNNPVPSA